MLAEHLPDLINVVVQKAKDGDGAALKVVFDRVLPTLRSRETLVTLQGLKADDSLCNQAKTVLEALSSGQITPSESASIMQTLQGRARLIETEELIERIEALENGDRGEHS